METRKITLGDVEETRRPNRARILAPLRYLTIRAPEKTKYDFIIPIAVGLLVWAGYNFLSPRPSLFGSSGILASVQLLLVLAVPFLIGALASVAMGSPGERIDKRAAGVGIFLDGRALSLRQFVCYLLGYLSFLGLVSLIIVVLSSFTAPSIMAMLKGSDIIYYAVRQLFSLGIFIIFSAFTTTVFWALYFLTDVVNRTD